MTSREIIREASKAAVFLTSLVSSVAWLALCCWVALCVVAFWKLAQRNSGVLAEVDLAVVSCLHVVAGYAVTRAVDAVCGKVAACCKEFTS